jgi:hypothetical protein
MLFEHSILFRRDQRIDLFLLAKVPDLLIIIGPVSTDVRDFIFKPFQQVFSKSSTWPAFS